MESIMRHFISLATVISVLAFAATTASAAETGKYCLKGPGTMMNCIYQNMASCNKARTGAQLCVVNPTH
jgi:Protein of unknown function (DUF3551)